eukprot:3605920-Amphidinium_carterae.4
MHPMFLSLVTLVEMLLCNVLKRLCAVFLFVSPPAQTMGIPCVPVTVYHLGVPSHSNWARRDRCRKDYWSSFTRQLPLDALSLVVHHEDADRLPIASHDLAVRLSRDAFHATALDCHIAVCEKQRKLFSKVIGLYPATTSDARSFKKRKLITGL